MIYIGIDNGVTGSVAILKPGEPAICFPTPVKQEQSYTKAKQIITRIDTEKLSHTLVEIIGSDRAGVLLERPMVYPGRFKATVSALRALEATLIVLEDLQMPLIYVDSKEWQRVLLPRGVKKDELKKASLDIGKRLFRHIDFAALKLPDADGLLIAEYGRRTQAF